MPGPMGGPRGGQTTEKAKDFKKTTKKLIRSYLAKYKIPIIVVMIFAIGSTIFTIVGPKILGNATTEIFNGLVNKLSGGSGINFGKVGQIALTLLGLYLISALFSFVQRFLMTDVAQKITYKIRNDIAVKINKLPMKYFDKKTNGEVLSIITNDIDSNIITKETSAEVNEQEDNKDDYFASSRLGRNTMYSQMIESYQNLLDNSNVGEEQKTVATQEITKINNIQNSIMICENLIKTKGIEDVVIFVNDKSISVIVKADKLENDTIAQIQNIIAREMDAEIENIHISNK